MASRTPTFRIQFVQRFLTGPPDSVWRDVASCIFRRINNLKLDATLFLTDLKFLKLSGLPQFYQGVLKSCTLFEWHRTPAFNSLYWLLMEPLVCGARLDVSRSSTPGLMGVLCSTKTVILKQLVDAAGPAITNAEAVGSLLRVRSVWLVENLGAVEEGTIYKREVNPVHELCEGNKCKHVVLYNE